MNRSTGSSSQDSESPKLHETSNSSITNGFLSAVASSATDLLTSITEPPPPLSTNSLLSSNPPSSSKSGHQGGSVGVQSSPLWSESTALYDRTAGLNNAGGFRSEISASSPLATIGDDYNRFLNEEKPSWCLPETQHIPASSPTTGNPGDGTAVAALLSANLAGSEVYRDEVSEAVKSVDRSHPAIIEFVGCEDPVEFLQLRPEWVRYTDCVWGGLLEVLEGAYGEVGKGKGKQAEGQSVEKLRMIWEGLRAKL
jgi:hypothetical protein